KPIQAPKPYRSRDSPITIEKWMNLYKPADQSREKICEIRGALSGFEFAPIHLKNSEGYLQLFLKQEHSFRHFSKWCTGYSVNFDVVLKTNSVRVVLAVVPREIRQRNKL